MTTYFVSPSGNNGAATTTATAKTTISAGCLLAVAGDTVKVLAGNYNGGIFISTSYNDGTTASPITLVSSPALAARIVALSTPATGGGNDAMLEVRANGWIIDGFEVTAEDGYNASNVWQLGGAGQYRAGIMISGLNLVAQNNWIHHTCQADPAGSGGGGIVSEGFYIGYSTANSHTVRYNHIHNTASSLTGNKAHGIYCTGNGTLVQGNLVYRVFGGVLIHGWHGMTGGSYVNNTVFSGAAGLLVGQGDGGASTGTNNFRCFNNIVRDCTTGIDEQGAITVPRNLYSNNCVYNCTTAYAINTTSTAVNKITNDPKFVNYISTGGGNYNLSIGSTLINGGLASLSGRAAPVLDIAGTVRPQDSFWDIGAYEFVSSTPPPPPDQIYFDLTNATNGNGASATPYNQTGFNSFVPVAGNTLYFKRGTTSVAHAFTLTSGTSGNLIRWTSYYNSDGTDDITKALPILTTTTVLSAFNGSNNNYVWLENIKVVASGFTVANDKALMWAGTGSKVTGCYFDSNVGALGIWADSDITISDNTFLGVSHSSANTNCVLLVSSTNMSNISISNNTFKHYGGGSTSSHNCRIEADSGNTITNLDFTNNIITTSTGVANANLGAIGLRTSNCTDATIDLNDIRFHLEGIFVTNGAATVYNITNNICRTNAHFGIHLSTNAVGCILDGNDCSFNGTSTYNGTTLLAYGRGIECSGAAGQDKCSGHTIRFNTCNNNYNYGGPLDNGSEGVGIGLDDSTTDCLVYGNTCKNNEGNGIQQYGGSPGTGTPVITDTGGNAVIANYCENNCTSALKNRRSGGTNTTLFNAHIAFGGSFGGTAYIAHNVCVINTPVGIAINVSCDDLIIANNIITSPHGISMDTGYSASVGVCNSNDFFGTTQNYCLRTVDVSGSATFASNPYVGTNDLTIDPKFTAAYSLSTGSAAIRAGFAIGTRLDFLGRTYKSPPSLGMFEDFTNPPNAGGNLRKRMYHGH